jgi:hypothetical protein
VTTTTVRPWDAFVRGLTGAWMPWLGKRFDATAQTGDNLLAASARVPVETLWRGYRVQPAGDGEYAAFRFRTYVDAGRVDADRQTLKIDYDSDDNPALLIRDILDELVQLVPGAYLGKVLLRRRGRRGTRWRLIGYFGLTRP